MSHPHPNVPPGDAEPPAAPRSVPRAGRRFALLGVLAGIGLVLALWLTYTATAKNREAHHATAAVSRACDQVESLGQQCATDPAQAAGSGQALAPIVPVVTGPVPGLSGAPSPASTVTTTAGAEGNASQAGEPGEAVNPGDDRIVGLTVRNGRLEVTYADQTVVDAGAIAGAPPPIVLIVASPVPSAAPPAPVPGPPGTVSPSPQDTTSSPEESGTP